MLQKSQCLKKLNNNNSNSPSLVGPIYLVGPTGTGKSSLACELAQVIGAEIIGADAYQIYSGLEILTAQPSLEQRQQVPHHLVGCIPATKPFDVAEYHRLASSAIAETQARKSTPLVIGGTGLYIRSLIAGLSPTPPADLILREKLSHLSLCDLVERLRHIDPEALAVVDLKNRRRVERAIEICETSGKPLAQFRDRDIPDARGILLVRERADLHGRIAQNIAHMFSSGVVDEVQLARDAGITASRAIGFREIGALLDGEISEAICKEKILIATRQYAKRQLTWFRHQSNFPTLNLTSIPPDQAMAAALDLLNSQ